MPCTPFTPSAHLALNYKLEGWSEHGSMVFIHALGCDLHLWDSVATAFFATHQVIRYDLRGHGLSVCGPPESRVEDHALDLVDLLDRLGVAAATLVGISFGGLVALAVAQHHPARVRRLVLCCTGARIGTTESWNERIAAVQARGLDATADAILARWFSPGFPVRDPSLTSWCRQQLVRTPVAGYVAVCTALRDTDLRPGLPGVLTPALVVSGEHDIATPPALGRELAAALPNARFVAIPGAAHLPPLEQPAFFAACVRQFLNETL